jgi:hypothetical protein
MPVPTSIHFSSHEDGHTLARRRKSPPPGEVLAAAPSAPEVVGSDLGQSPPLGRGQNVRLSVPFLGSWFLVIISYFDGKTSQSRQLSDHLGSCQLSVRSVQCWRAAPSAHAHGSCRFWWSPVVCALAPGAWVLLAARRDCKKQEARSGSGSGWERERGRRRGGGSKSGG